jgi:hypothetical protein
MTDPIRNALAELVALKDLKDEESRLRQRRECSILRQPNKLADANAMREEYNRRKPVAWDSARAALAAPPAAPAEPAALTDEEMANCGLLSELAPEPVALSDDEIDARALMCTHGEYLDTREFARAVIAADRKLRGEKT